MNFKRDELPGLSRLVIMERRKRAMERKWISRQQAEKVTSVWAPMPYPFDGQESDDQEIFITPSSSQTSTPRSTCQTVHPKQVLPKIKDMDTGYVRREFVILYILGKKFCCKGQLQSRYCTRFILACFENVLVAWKISALLLWPNAPWILRCRCRVHLSIANASFLKQFYELFSDTFL